MLRMTLAIARKDLSLTLARGSGLVQALLLARHLRGDLDGYPPFLWK